MTLQPPFDDVRPFLDAICAVPDDDAPRLIFADWLEERGEVERAEFIRLQCLAASTEEDETRWAADARAWQIRQAIGGHLYDGLAPRPPSARFHRGLLASVVGGPPDVLTLAPVRWVSWTYDGLDPMEWCQAARPGLVVGLDLHRHQKLSLSGQLAPLQTAGGSGVRQLRLHLTHDFASAMVTKELAPILARIEDLTVDHAFADPQWLQQGGQALPALRRLRFPIESESFLGGSAASGGGEILAEFDRLDDLDSLDLGGAPGAWAALVRHRRATGLRRLGIRFDPSLRTIAEDWRPWSRLESVTVWGWRERGRRPIEPDPAAFRRLVAGLASLPSLRSLRLVGPFDFMNFQMLSETGGFPALRALRFDGHDLRSVDPLRQAPWMERLRELWITGFREDEAIGSLSEWLAHPVASGLRRLGLRGIAWSDREINELVTSPLLQGLIVLDLPDARIGVKGARLLALDHLPSLLQLELGRIAGDHRIEQSLLRRHGLALQRASDRRQWWSVAPSSFDGDHRTPWEELA